MGTCVDIQNTICLHCSQQWTCEKLEIENCIQRAMAEIQANPLLSDILIHLNALKDLLAKHNCETIDDFQKSMDENTKLDETLAFLRNHPAADFFFV